MGRAPQHRERIVQTAVRLFRRQGYASTGVQQILDVSGAPKGSLYHYFPGGKEAIGEAAVVRAGELVRETLQELAEARPSPRAFLRGYCGVMADWMEESGFRSGCPLATTVLETTPASPAIQAAGLAAIDSWIDVIASVYRRAGTPARRARMQAQLVIASVEGGLILARLNQSKKPLHEVATLLGQLK